MTKTAQSITMEGDLTSASPSGNAVSSFINDSVASLNESFFLPRITQNEDSLLSPNVQSPAPYSVADFGVHANIANKIYNRVLQDLQTTFSRGAIDFYQSFEQRLESIVDLKMDSSTYKESLLSNFIVPLTAGTNQAQLLEERLKKIDEAYEDFMDKYDKFNQVNDKRETANETLSDKLRAVKADITELDKGLRDLRLAADESIARGIQENLSTPAVSTTNTLEPRVQSLELACKGFRMLSEQFSVELDDVNQYNRQYIAQFLNIINRGTTNRPERTTDVILEFLRKFLGMRISNRDISICHRQDIPSLRRKMGKKYIVPIYCKFVNRSIVHEIMRRRHLLKNVRNALNNPYIIEENLTPNRRVLWESVQKKLTNFRSKWVFRGSIYVRKHANSEKIKVISEHVLNDLVAANERPGTDTSLSAQKQPIRKDPPSTVNVSNQSKYSNRYASIVNSKHFPCRSGASQTRPKLPYPPSNFSHFNELRFPQVADYSTPLFTFRNKSFVDYRSAAF